MPISDPSKILFSTSYNYFLSYDAKNGSVSVPSTSYSAGQVKSYTVTIPIARVKDFSQIQVGFSFDPSKWYVFPFGDVTLSISFGSISTVGSYGGSSLTMTFYVVNQSGAPATNAAFDVTVRSLLFVTPT